MRDMGGSLSVCELQPFPPRLVFLGRQLQGVEINFMANYNKHGYNKNQVSEGITPPLEGSAETVKSRGLACEWNLVGRIELGTWWEERPAERTQGVQGNSPRRASDKDQGKSRGSDVSKRRDCHPL